MPAAGLYLLFARPFILHVFRRAIVQVVLLTAAPIAIYAAITALLYCAAMRRCRAE